MILSAAMATPSTFQLNAGAEFVQSRAIETHMLSGRLATVQPALRLITVVPDGETTIVELVVPPEARILEQDRDARVLPLSALVIQVGSRVTIGFRFEGNLRVASSVMIAAER